MAVYIGHDECQVIYVAKNGQQLRVSSVWVGDQQVFPPANRQEVHVIDRNTQGYGREDYGAMWGFSVPVPWWATSVDVVIIGAGEKGRDGTKSFTGGSDGAGGRSGAWVVKTVALNPSHSAMVTIGKGTGTAPAATSVAFYGGDGHPAVTVDDGEGTRTANSGSTGGSVSPRQRTEYGQMHNGGYGGSRNNSGSHPGGGGGGGQGSNLLGNPTSGRDGGDGYVWLRFRSDAPIGGGGFTLYLGTITGDAYQPLRDWAVSIGETYQTITEITVPIGIIGPRMDRAFQGCTALVSAPEMDFGQVTSAQYLFGSCESLVSVPQYDTSNVTAPMGLFFGCSSLKSLPPLDMRSADLVTAFFGGCTSLESVSLPHLGEGFKAARTLDMKATKLNAAAANALMESLGTVPSSADYPGTLQLPATATGADTTIATAKNWTVTIG